ncbi:hypothetical protein [Bradyrhizobium sp. Ec3.3]|uniref:hypothetical protein n=1 Tax=Bradyrhizobium sp. Ec3.3 TaxID=189753 RepID=UPI00041E7C7C|nr:hypothetical protein [Bradyrhizobium sp. Ec3.3]
MSKTLLFVYLAATTAYFFGLCESALFQTYNLCLVDCFFVSGLSAVAIMRYLLLGRINVFCITAYATVAAYLFPFGLAAAFQASLVQEDYWGHGFAILMIAFPLLVFGSSDQHDIDVSNYFSRRAISQNIGQIGSLILGLALLETVLLLTQQWTYGSTNFSQGERTSPIVLLAGQVTVGLAGFCGLVSGTLSSRLRMNRLSETLVLLLSLSVLLLQVLWWLPVGRRFLMVQLLLGVITFLAARNHFRLSARKLVILGAWLALLAPIGLFLTRIFVTLRVLSWSRSGARVDLFELLSQLGSVDPNTVSMYQDQAAARALILDSYALVARYVTRPFLGLEAITQFLLALPSAFFDKTYVLDQLGGANEALWTNMTGIPYSDYAQTLLLEGYIDFSYFGFFIYVLAINLMFRALLVICHRFGGLAAFGVVFYGLFYTLLQVEGTVGGILDHFRCALIIVIAGRVLQMYFAPSLRFRSLRQRRLVNCYVPATALIALFYFSDSAQATERSYRSIREWTSCNGSTDDRDGVARAFDLAKHNSFELLIDCPLFVHVGTDISRPIFIEDGTTVDFAADGKFIIDNVFMPTWVIANSQDIKLRGWRVEYKGSMPVDPDTGGYTLNGRFVRRPGSYQPAAAFHDLALTPWLTKNRGIVFDRTKGHVSSPWIGPTATASVFYILGSSSKIRIRGMKLFATHDADASRYIPVCFSTAIGFNSNQQVSAQTAIERSSSTPSEIDVDDMEIDGAYMGWVGVLQDSQFRNIRSLRYGDLQDLDGKNVGGIGKWFAPPHLFYLTTSANLDLGNRHILIENVLDLGIRAGLSRDDDVRSRSGYALSLKIAARDSQVLNYTSFRPDGLLDVLPSTNLTIKKLQGTYNSSFLNGIYPAIRFPSGDYTNVTLSDVELEDLAPTATIAPITGAGGSSHVVMRATKVILHHPEHQALTKPSFAGIDNVVDVVFIVK